MIKSVVGKILFVNLSDGSHRVEDVPQEVYQNYLSGLGLGVHTLYNHIPAGADPFGEDNMLGFVGGILTGTGAMFSGRFLVVGKSPITGGWGDANCGGNLAPLIKQSGYDGIFIKGIVSQPVYVHVHNGKVEILPAEDLWGKDTIDTEDTLIQRHGTRARVACIGPAGENLVRYAGISNHHGRMAGRSGLGAVMGSKKLKALVLEGKNKVEIHDRATIQYWSKATSKLMPRGKSSIPGWVLLLMGRIMNLLPINIRIDGLMSLPPFGEWGTNSTNELSVVSGDAPVRNWRGNPAMYPTKNVGVNRISTYQRKKYHCTACPLGCGSVMEISGRYKETHRAEYETVTAFGSNLLNQDLDSIFDMNEYCNRMGLDSISTGSVIGFAMDCYEQGLLPENLIAGLLLEWGNQETISKLVEMITYRQGLGDLLAEGVYRAAKVLGDQAQKYAIHSGGQELPMHDPRMDPVYGVIYLADPTPGRHTITNTMEYEMFNLWTRVSWAPKPAPQYPKREKYENSQENAAKNAAGAMYKAILDCAGLCLFGAHIGVDRSGIFEMLNAATGLELTPDEYMRTGQRVQDLRQWFNIRHGVEPDQVVINALVRGQPPAVKGPARGLSYDLDGMRRKYWQAMGWNEMDGHPLEQPGLWI